MLNLLYKQAYLVDSQAADAIWEEWWLGDMTDFAVGWAWRNLTAGVEWREAALPPKAAAQVVVFPTY